MEADDRALDSVEVLPQASRQQIKTIQQENKGALYKMHIQWMVQKNFWEAITVQRKLWKHGNQI